MHNSYFVFFVIFVYFVYFIYFIICTKYCMCWEHKCCSWRSLTLLLVTDTKRWCSCGAQQQLPLFGQRRRCGLSAAAGIPTIFRDADESWNHGCWSIDKTNDTNTVYIYIKYTKYVNIQNIYNIYNMTYRFLTYNKTTFEMFEIIRLKKSIFLNFRKCIFVLLVCFVL